MSALKGMTKEEQEALEAAETREALEARMLGVELRAAALKAEKLAKARSNSKAGAVRDAEASAASQKQAVLDQRFAAAQVIACSGKQVVPSCSMRKNYFIFF